MRTKRCSWTTFALLIVPRVLSATDIFDQTAKKHPFKNCEKTWKLVKKEWNAEDGTFLIDAREYVSHCSATMDRPQQVRLLGHMGETLMRSKEYEEAIPILQECTKQAFDLNGDRADCWQHLGEAADILGYCESAVIGYKAALEVPTTDSLAADAHKIAAIDLDSPGGVPGGKCSNLKSSPPAHVGSLSSHLFGTAFFISDSALLLTNDHVVKDCTAITTKSGAKVRVVSRDLKSDLALLKGDGPVQHFGIFRAGELVKMGEPVIAFGFPFPGLLSSGGTITSGVVSSLLGLRDDPRTMQFSAAVQPGNSGGPLFDESGHVIGVVEAKLDALQVANYAGAIPENVGFAIQWAQIRAFLESEGVNPIREASTIKLSSSDIAMLAQQITTAIDCAK